MRICGTFSNPWCCFKQIRNSVTHDVVTKHDAVVMTKLLPERGLNEVFVGELDSTEPSFLEIEVNQSGRTERIKCSGMTKKLIQTAASSALFRHINFDGHGKHGVEQSSGPNNNVRDGRAE